MQYAMARAGTGPGGRRGRGGGSEQQEGGACLLAEVEALLESRLFRSASVLAQFALGECRDAAAAACATSSPHAHAARRQHTRAHMLLAHSFAALNEHRRALHYYRTALRQVHTHTHSLEWQR